MTVNLYAMPDAEADVLLAGRTARCSCGREAPSALSLAFFGYCGPGSDEEARCELCPYMDSVHQPVNPHTGRAGVTDHPFAPRPPAEFDRWYCGCRGWD